MSRLVLLLLFATPLLAAPVPKAKDKPSLGGTWEVIERHEGGKPLFRCDIREVWECDGTQVTVRYGADDAPKNGVEATGFKLELPDVSDPTAVNILQSTPKGVITSVGRAEFDGDTVRLVFALGADDLRPAKAETGAGVSYVKLKRVDQSKAKSK